jgi:hypothetical protein
MTSTKYLTPYEQETIRECGEILLRGKIEDGTAQLEPKAQQVVDRLVRDIGIRMLCHKVRLQLEKSRDRDLSKAVIEVGSNQGLEFPGK